MPRKNPAVIAYHLVWTAYGTWLPNDPRGSGSRRVASPDLAELGELHYGRRKVQPPPSTVRGFNDRAEPRLQFPVIRFDPSRIETVAAGFESCIFQHRYTCYACAVLPDHVRILIRKHRDRAEEMIENLQQGSRLQLATEQRVPAAHPVWTLGGYRRFLDSPDHVRTVIRYIEQNPTRAGLPSQQWPFVHPYDGWPYAKR
ncbi:MAG: hypothetical protein DWQ37_05970 [Planctomycetota bacterium]|nr:MAG: hypothetical protein DWQ37_05970 [Planctomycetota bacterium]